MPYHALETTLRRLGFSDKESAVYVAMLGLGPSSVLRISRKAGVARATTYLVLEQLTEKGMVSTYDHNGSQHFIAEEPEHLRHLIDKRRVELDREEELLADIIPRLEAVTWSEDHRPTVRYYQGREGLQTLRSEMLRTSEAGDTWYNLTPSDHLYKVFGDGDYTYDRQRIARGIKSKTMFTTKSAERKKELLAPQKGSGIERKYIEPKHFTSGTGITITNNRVAVGTMEKQLSGFIVESESVATALRELFQLAWEGK